MTVRPRRQLRRSDEPARHENVRKVGAKSEKKPSAPLNWVELRFKFALIVFVIFWGVLWYAAFTRMIVEGDTYREMAARQMRSTETIVGRRGSITDRNGIVLACSVEVQSVYANPREIESPAEAADKLAPFFGLDRGELIASLSKNKSFVWIKRKISDSDAKAVRDMKLKGVYLDREYERFYPYKQLAGQLLGFVGIDNQGLEGLELAFNDVLKGETTKASLKMDPSGRRFAVEKPEAHDGQDLRLTLDVQIQYIAEEVISEAVRNAKAKWGGVLIADAKSGELLAWGQYPFFNPNNVRAYSAERYRNRLASDALEPGSTFTPFAVAAGLETGVIDAKTQFFCENGVWATRLITIRDDGRSYGDMTAEEILAKSSNIGAAKIAQAVGTKTFHSYLSKLGFGTRTGIGINESKGILRRPNQWSEADLLSTGFGQSVSATAIQMVQAYLTLMNNGVYLPVKLVMKNSGGKDDGGDAAEKPAAKRIFSAKTSRTVRSMMEEVVDGNGTGSRARIPGIRVAGKTGTAQKAVKKGGYGDARLASFIGILPADAPRYIIWVMLDEPTVKVYGGVLAAPVFQEVASRTMAYQGYLPDVIFPQKDEAKGQAGKKKQPRFDKTVIPNVQGMGLRLAMEQYQKCGLTPSIHGSGLTVLLQDPQPGTPVKDDSGNPVPCTIYMSLDTPEDTAEDAGGPAAEESAPDGQPSAEASAGAPSPQKADEENAPAPRRKKAENAPLPGDAKENAAARQKTEDTPGEAAAEQPKADPKPDTPALPRFKPGERSAAERSLLELTSPHKKEEKP